MAAREKKEPRKRHFLRWIVIGGGMAGVAYAMAQRQKPGPCVPAGSPGERVMVKDEENIGGLGSLMSTLITQLLQDSAKVEQLNSLNLVLAIEPSSMPEAAITMTFSDGYVVLEPGVVPAPDIHIVCELDVLMQMAAMGYGLKALKFMASPDGRQMAEKFRSGELQIKGLTAHPVRMMKFSRFLAMPEGDTA